MSSISPSPSLPERQPPDFRFRTAALGFVLTLAVLLAGGVVGYNDAGRAVEDNRMVRSTHDVVVSLVDYLAAMADAETGQRGFLLTGDAAYLQPYLAATAAVHDKSVRLETFLANDSTQHAAFALLERLVHAKLDELAQTVAMETRGDHAGALRVVHTDHGKILMDSARATAAAMTRYEQGQRDRWAADAETTASALIWCILLTTVLGVLLVSIVLYLVRRSVADQQRATAVVAEQKERLRTTLGSIGDGVISVDSEGQVTSLNAVAEELTGWSSAQAAGQPLTRVFHIVNETTRDVVDNPALRAMREGVIVGLANHTVLVTRDGLERPIDDSGAPIRDASGSTIGGVLVFRDVTDRRKTERKSLALTEELGRVAADLAEANRRKDEFLATLAHELRNPLAPLRNGLEIMRLSGTESAAPPAARSAMAMMERQVEQMVRLVDDLLDVSRISGGKQQLQIEPVELATILQHAAETSGPVIDSGGHTLTVRVPPEPVWINGDAIRLEQVFINLINNAAKYSERSGRIEVAGTVEDGTVVVRVKDSGVGIPSAMLSRIFDLFTQVDDSLEKSQGGLGIGLTLAKGLVEMHGGSVTAFSAGAGAGSEFVVRLPLASPDNRPSSVAAASGKPSTAARRRRILIADDNTDSTDTLEMLLQLMGHEVRTASDGVEAVAVATEFRPEVILLDLGMPRMNGYDACRRIREQPWGAAIVVIALSGWGQDADRQHSADAGFDHHMVKPLDPSALDALLNSLPGAAGAAS